MIPRRTILLSTFRRQLAATPLFQAHLSQAPRPPFASFVCFAVPTLPLLNPVLPNEPIFPTSSAVAVRILRFANAILPNEPNAISQHAYMQPLTKAESVSRCMASVASGARRSRRFRNRWRASCEPTWKRRERRAPCARSHTKLRDYLLYGRGRGVAKDLPAAVKWLKKAGEKGRRGPGGQAIAWAVLARQLLCRRRPPRHLPTHSQPRQFCEVHQFRPLICL
jgi:hypothetical protein